MIKAMSVFKIQLIYFKKSSLKSSFQIMTYRATLAIQYFYMPSVLSVYERKQLLFKRMGSFLQ